MTLHVKDAGSWVEPEQVHVKVAGVWTEVQEVWVKNAGAWAQVFTAADVVNPLPGGLTFDGEIAPSDADAGWRFDTDGTVDRDSGSGFALHHNWFDPTTSGIGGSYWIRATLNSGDTPSGTLNTWLALSTARSWSLSETGTGTKACSLTIEIATDSGGATIVTSGTYSIQVEVSA